MPTAEAAICNLALSHARSARFIEALTEESEEARICSVHYATTRDSVLESADWPFARKRAALVLSGTPPSEWGYSYAMPTDCIAPRAIADGLVVRVLSDRIPFQIENDGSGARLLYMNKATATLIYTMRAKDPTIYTPSFVEAFAWKLAANIARPLDRSESMISSLLQTAEQLISRAAARNYNQEKHPEAPQSDLFTSRLG